MNARVIMAIVIKIPPQDLIRRSNAPIEPLRKHMRSKVQENATLTTLRDTLLPDLMLGRLRIRDAERITADCV